jgi:hypothetical protein
MQSTCQGTFDACGAAVNAFNLWRRSDAQCLRGKSRNSGETWICLSQKAPRSFLGHADENIASGAKTQRGRLNPIGFRGSTGMARANYETAAVVVGLSYDRVSVSTLGAVELVTRERLTRRTQGALFER